MPRIDKLLNQPTGKESKDLQAIIDKQAKTIERMRAAKTPAVKLKRGRRSKKAFVRVIFGDVHGTHMNQAAMSALLNDIDTLQPDEIVCIGDLLDCGGFLSQHKTLGVVAELETTYEEDVAIGNYVLDELHRIVPKARVTYIEGNHENRINRWICDQVVGNAANADYLRRLFGPAAVLSLEQRKVRYVERHEYYDGLSISGTIKLEPYAVAQHGEAFCGKYAAHRHLERLGKSIFFGHCHRLGATYAENLDGSVMAVCTGCLCDTRPVYGLTKTTDWTHGYAVQFVEPEEGFLALPVPIINGKSYLSPLVSMVK